MNIIIFTDSNGALGFGRYAGPYRVATELRKAGFTVQVVDFFAELWQSQLIKIIDKLVTNDTLWVGFSTTLFAPGINSEIIKETIRNGEYNNSFMIENWKTGTWPRTKKQVIEMYNLIKQRNPNTKIVLGGTKAVRTTSFIPIDYYVWGEADVSAVELSRHLKDNTYPIKSDEFGSGIRLLGDDYSVGPMHGKTIEWADNDYIFNKEVLPIELSRGCIFKCSYCSFKNLGQKKGDNTYLKDIDVFRNEVTRNYEKFGTQSYMFSDDTFNDSPDKVRRYADCIQGLPFKLSWAGYCRIDMLAISENMIHDLKLTNPDFINFGIETFCHQAGKTVGKGMDPNRVKDTLHKTKEILGKDTTLSCNFITGLRYETEDEIWKTVEWLTSADCPVDAFNFTPLYILHYRRDVKDKTSDFSNEIGNDPTKFGYEYNPDTGYWKHETMDQIRAHEIVNEIYKMQEAQTKTLANRIGFFGRLQNLGLTLDDLQSVTATNEKPVLNLVTKKIELKNQYVKRILNG